jgi:hypothetical protein
MYTTDLVELDRDDLGVYELGDGDKNTVYYGSGKVKMRLMDHLRKKDFPMAKFYRAEYFGDEHQCRAREEQLLKDYENAHGKVPVYNEKVT